MKATNERIIVFDTETTGMNMSGPHYEGHRIIEIGAVEIINRKLTGNTFHVYIKPDRAIDPEAIEVHGITDEFLVGKPTYAEIHQEFMDFIQGAELVAHNAPFDIGFMDYEFRKLGLKDLKTDEMCKVTDTLDMAKRLFPGKRNNLDILCSRYGIDNSHRTLHGALLDAEILADVYLMMTGGQTSLQLSSGESSAAGAENEIRRLTSGRKALKVVRSSADEITAHEGRLDLIGKKADVIWRI
ncbi:DNA polymerase III subunit epsilon [Photobacterium damselae subsp. piscicida]|uniref:DNA polymerase III subunit epsilon n=1 Tax=Photobacterium damsela subsp. piscicida TaxID=38294 RepID=L7NJP4_PHODP|nr:DNA polymerase III subunit epsilon [Photobacterium damselae]AEU09982.1 DNA polymerase III epsilon subunit [Photobacterium damselae subsp. piscicida]PSV78932.1 DNA polymerase III subunit epsilon [Photobacterium damselae]PSW83567.1 DNA polymerase III subunit epsilon [Photobacterium damselae]QOD53247.1 DNA polymerase III subunit epsilon [Photobacterium damselae subsp. piscicida]QOD57085.1 DNA polymerase III subunit epsilon [Photobacterium damselae subsp. piscicida]